jgi:lipopolysaccharide transport system ATP-binding protein
MKDIAIRLENLGKEYRIGQRQQRYATLRDGFADIVTAPFRHVASRFSARVQDSADKVQDSAEDKTIWAVRDLSCEIGSGEVVAVIGRNGAGKSTLLKILSRITEPTVGFAEIHGRVGSLLEVGTGFHFELTGRENIYLNGVILGMTKGDIDRRFDEIVDFSGVEKFIDTPVKHYSSGMYLRLAFAVAAHLDLEILLVDEVLAVGDMMFQRKCLGKMQDVARQGRTVLFVSHNLAAVEHLCQRGIVLRDGRFAFDGDVNKAIQFYLQDSDDDSAASHSIELTTAAGRPPNYRPLLKNLNLFTDNGLPVTNGLRIGAPLTVNVHFLLELPVESFDVGLGFDDMSGRRILTAHSLFQPGLHDGKRVGEQTMICEIPSLTLMPGEYRLRVSLNVGGALADVVENAVKVSVVASDYYGTGKVPWNGTFVLEQHWRLADGNP